MTQQVATKHEGDVRQFIIFSQAWYAESNRGRVGNTPGEDEITMGFYSPEGGTSGEFCIKWEPLSGRIVPRLHAFDDSWSALAGFADVIAKLAELDGTGPSVAQVAELLKSCGVVDATERVSPYKERTSASREQIESVAHALEIQTSALESIRTIGRDLAVDGTWAKDVEFGATPAKVDGVSNTIYRELSRAAAAVKSSRDTLRQMLEGLHDLELNAKYKALAYPKEPCS